jgi:hypothetical protein
MSQFQNPPVRRSGGGIDVYAGLLCVALLVLAAGVFLLAKKNIEHSAAGNQDGSVFKLVD